MSTILNQTIPVDYSDNVNRSSIFTRFTTWCASQEQNRLLWLGISLAGHGCIITPITILAVVLAGTNMILVSLVLAAMTATLIVNLAALPAKITIPVFVLSVLIDVSVLISCAVIGFGAY